MGWSDLPSELLMAIAGNLTEFTDHIRFRSVCSHWRSSSSSLRLSPHLPWLTLSSLPSTHFVSLSENRLYPNPSPHVSKYHYLFGSLSGWFLSISWQRLRITSSLVNLFTGASIGLPSSDSHCFPFNNQFLEYHIWDRSDSVVMVGCNRTNGVFYCRLSEAVWCQLEPLRYTTPSSITYCEGRFYILKSETYDIVVFDGKTLEDMTVIVAPDLDYPHPLYAHLLVSYNELLLLVERPLNHRCSQMYKVTYEVHRVKLDDEMVEWVEVNDIGDRALFVDSLRCFSVEVRDNDQLRKNCIYMAESEGIGRSKMYQSRTYNSSTNRRRMYSIFVFDLGNRCLEHLDCALCRYRGAYMQFAVPPPSRVVPSLN